MTTKVAVIGAGSVGGNLGARLSRAGFPIRFGVRDEKSAAPVLARCAKDASATDASDAAKWADLVFLAVPGAVALDVARSLAKELDGKIVVDCNNPMTWNGGPIWNPSADGSLAAAIARIVPGAHVIKGFNTFGAEFHDNPDHAGAPAQVFFAGDNADAKKTFAEVASKAGFLPVDAGPLRNAAVLENLAMLWIHLATVGGHGRDFVFTMQTKS